MYSMLYNGTIRVKQQLEKGVITDSRIITDNDLVCLLGNVHAVLAGLLRINNLALHLRF